jgi:hypothetical protein
MNRNIGIEIFSSDHVAKIKEITDRIKEKYKLKPSGVKGQPNKK